MKYVNVPVAVLSTEYEDLTAKNEELHRQNEILRTKYGILISDYQALSTKHEELLNLSQNSETSADVLLNYCKKLERDNESLRDDVAVSRIEIQRLARILRHMSPRRFTMELQ